MIAVEAIPAIKDNYIWLLSAAPSHAAWVVDPGEAQPVLDRLAQQSLSLAGVLLTHNHPDHDGGIPGLRLQFPTLRVISGHHSQSPYTTERYANHALIDVLGQPFELIEVAGHVRDHVAFYSATQKLLFSGDTLFAGGCGRIFDGTPEQLFNSLMRIAALPGNTLNYCAHEYTESNLRFALALEPGNPYLQQRAIDTRALRANNIPSIPSLLSLELATNPFLRCREPSIMAAARSQTQSRLDSPLDVFTTIRAWKNRF